MIIQRPILHIDTSTLNCSVALSDGGQLIRSVMGRDAKAHSQQLSPLIYQLLQTHHLQVQTLAAVSINVGPGSYTGLRIAVGVVKGMLYRTQVPVISIPIHEAIIYDQKICKRLAPTQVILHKRRDRYLIYNYDKERHLISSRELLGQELIKLNLTDGLSIQPIDKMDTQVISPMAFHLVKPTIKRLDAGHFISADQLKPIYFDAPYITKRKKELL